MSPMRGSSDLTQLLESKASWKPRLHSKSSRVHGHGVEITGSLLSRRLKHSERRLPWKFAGKTRKETTRPVPETELRNPKRYRNRKLLETPGNPSAHGFGRQASADVSRLLSKEASVSGFVRQGRPSFVILAPRPHGHDPPPLCFLIMGTSSEHWGSWLEDSKVWVEVLRAQIAVTSGLGRLRFQGYEVLQNCLRQTSATLTLRLIRSFLVHERTLGKAKG